MTDLTDRMRTCAAYLIGAEKAGDGGLRDFGRAIIDAADLLIEASNALEAAPAMLGEPIEVISVPDARQMPELPGAAWIAPGGPLPGLTRSGTVSRNACPKCDSRTNKRVHRQGNSLVLECPVCGHAWKRA